MAKYVPDVKTNRWVIISTGRSIRPDDTSLPKKTGCPFCTGNESMTPPEVYRIGNGDKDAPGWRVRVVPNKFPITDIHEVIIHSPDNDRNIEGLPISQVRDIIATYRDRFRAHEPDGQVIIFCNHGASAGASLTHPHSQLVVVPKQINLDALSREPIANIVEENTSYVTYCPDFSQWPLEMWIAPKSDGTKFSDVTDKELLDLAEVLQKTLMRLEKVYNEPLLKQINVVGNFVYNYYIHHAENWFIRIIPRFVHRAGFELGTGLNVNIVDPTEAAKILQKIEAVHGL